MFSIQDVVVLKSQDKFQLVTVRELTTLPIEFDLRDRPAFDAVMSLPNDLVLVKTGNDYDVLNKNLGMEIDFDRNTMAPSLSPLSDSLMLDSNVPQPFISNDPWVAMKADSSWRLYNTLSAHFLGSAYDSIIFSGPFAMAYKKDSVRTYFSEYNFADGAHPVKVEVMPGQDSSAFLVLEGKDTKSIYDQRGQQLFTITFDKIAYAGYGLFIVDKGGKKGLINREGKIILPLVYDAVGTVNHGIVSLLKSLKFGLYDVAKKKLIKPEYDKNLSLHNTKLISAYKNGFYGFIGWDNKPFSKFEFNEVQYWNDTAAFVKQGSQWMIYEFKTRNILLKNVKKIKIITNKLSEKIAIVQQDGSYGVLHSKKGTILPMSFTDLKNVGSADHPMYFTEKHVEEASIFVVIYYDDEGKMLRKEVYEHDEYEKIYCPYN